MLTDQSFQKISKTLLIWLFGILSSCLLPARLDALSVSALTFSPAAPQAGQALTVSWTYNHVNGEGDTRYAIFFKQGCSIANGGTAGQQILLGDACSTPDADNLLGGNNECWATGNGTATGTYPLSATVTVPSGLLPGQSYEIIVVMGLWWWELQNGNALSGTVQQSCRSFTYTLPGPVVEARPSVNKLHANAGDTLTYWIVARNIGDTTASNLVVQDTLPAGLNPTPLSESFSVAPSATNAGPPRSWTFATLAPGSAISITMVVATSTGFTGTRVIANYASAYSSGLPQPLTTTPPALSFTVEQPGGCWSGYAQWEESPVTNMLGCASAGDGRDYNEGNLHIYSLINGTYVSLSRSSGQDSFTLPYTIDTAEPGFPAALNAGRNMAFGPFSTRFHKIMSNYPVLWEYDSPNLADRTGRQMLAMSTDFKFSDNKPFYTYLDYNQKVPASNLGDGLMVINTSTSSWARFAVYRSNAGSGGAAWASVGDYSVGPEGVALVGGVSQATGLVYGDFLIVPYGPDALTPGNDLIVSKGQASVNDLNNVMPDGGALYGAGASGRKVADATAGNNTLYGICPQNGRIIVTVVSGAPTVQIYRYTPTLGAMAPWPISGTSGTWTLLSTFAPAAPAAGGSTAANNIAETAGVYKVVVTGGGSVNALFGGKIFDWNTQGDGDYVPSSDNAAAQGNANPSLLMGRDFWFSNGGSTGGSFNVIMPYINTRVNVQGNINVGTISCPDTPKIGENLGQGWHAPSYYVDQAWRFNLGPGNGNVGSSANTRFHVTSDKDVLLTIQAEDYDHTNKAFAGAPQWIEPQRFDLVKSANSAACYTLGDTVTFCMSYSNLGCDATNYKVWDTVPAAVQYLGSDNGGVYAGGMVQWTLPSVPSGGTGTLCFWGRIIAFSQAPGPWAPQQLAWLRDEDLQRWLR